MDRGAPRITGEARPDDELRIVTSLFADVVGSTSLGERLGPGEIKALIGECVTRMCEAVEGFGGHVGAYMGDGIAAFFGLETATEDDVERAVRAAIEVIDVVGAYAREVETAWGIDDFSVRVGINQGRVGVGRVGWADPQRLALGDAVNVAARLQAAARPGTIVVGRVVADRLRGRYELRSLGQVAVKGRLRTVEAFECVAQANSDAHHRPVEFVGRQAELEAVRVVIGDLIQGRGSICTVLGEGGLGKSRLVKESRRRAPSDVLWLEGRCDPIDQRLPYEPFVAPLRSWLGVDERAAPIEIRVRLSARGPTLLGNQFDEVAPHLARLLGVSLDSKEDRRLQGFPPEVLISNLFGAYRQWLIALSQTSPVVVAVDGFDVATAATTEFASAMLSIVDEAPVAFLFTMRRTPTSPAWATRILALSEYSHRACEIELQPLSRNEAQELVRVLERGASMDERLQDLVIGRAEGNPLYIEELVTAVSGDSGEPDDLPRALETLLLARIDSLPRDARLVVQASAVLGRVFAKEVLLGMQVVGDTERAISVLLRSEVLRECGRWPIRYTFRHGLLRDAALSTVSPSRLRELNASAARALRDSNLEDERDVESLARYYVASGNSRQASECFEELASRLEMVFQYEEATRLLETSLDSTPAQNPRDRWRLTRKLAELLVRLGRHEFALELLDEIEDDPKNDDVVAEVSVTRSFVLFEANRTVDAERSLRTALKLGVPEPARTQALVLLGRVGLEKGDFSLTRECADRLSIEESPPDVSFGIASLRAGASALSGDFDDAEVWALRAQEHARQSANLPNQLIGKRHLALVYVMKGCVREAYELMNQVYRTCVDVGHVGGQLETAVNLLSLAYLVGEVEEGVRIAEELLGLTPGREWEPLILANLAALMFEKGDFDVGEHLAHAVINREGEVPAWTQVTALVVQAAAHDLRREFDEARERLDEALVQADRCFPTRRPLVLAAQAELATGVGQIEVATACAKAAIGELDGVEKPVYVTAHRVAGYVMCKAGEPSGRDLLFESLESARQMGLRLEEARVQIALGSVDPRRAADWFAEAERIFTECSSGFGLTEVEIERSGLLPASG